MGDLLLYSPWDAFVSTPVASWVIRGPNQVVLPLQGCGTGEAATAVPQAMDLLRAAQKRAVTPSHPLLAWLQLEDAPAFKR